MLRLRYRLILFIPLIFIGITCKKQGYSRFLAIKCNVKILPDTPVVRVGDTVRITAWMPFNSYDYDSRTWVDIRNIQVRTWGGVFFSRLDTSRNAVGNISMISPAIDQYFFRSMIAGAYTNLSQNFYAAYFEKRDTCFFFEMQLIPRTQGYYYLSPLSAGRGFMNNENWSVDIGSEIVNSSMNQYLKDEIGAIFTPYENDYFFKIVP